MKQFFQATSKLEILNDFCRHLGIENYSDGDIIYNQGEALSTDKIYFMIHGKCELRHKHMVDLAHGMFEERERVECTVSEGMVFGEEVATSDEPRPSSAKCLQSCVVVTISKQNMKHVIAENNKRKKQLEEFKQGSKALVMHVLSKRRDTRTKEEVEAVATYLKTRISFFAKFSTEQQNELCRIAESVSFWERQVLFKQGQVGQAFYIVLTGTVEVYVANAEVPL